MTIAAPPAPAWADAFDELIVGQAFHTGSRTVTQDDVTAFAALTGDHHPQHVDEAWAAGSPFGGRIAHGMLVVSLAVGLVPFDPERVMALRRVGDVVFKRPVRPGDAIRVSGRIEALRDLDEEAGLVTFGWRILDQENRLVCRATVDVLWRRDTFVPIPL
jgi:3-hydroxybutyryl-CoA dehydratase